METRPPVPYPLVELGAAVLPPLPQRPRHQREEEEQKEEEEEVQVETPAKPPNLMSLTMSPGLEFNLDWSIPRSVPAFVKRFGYNPLDVGPTKARHFWKMLKITKYDRKLCPCPKLHEWVWDWWTSFHGRPENFAQLRRAPINASPAPQLTQEQVERVIEEEEEIRAREDLPSYRQYELLEQSYR